MVNGDGETVANYRKSYLYYTDETWAKEGGGFYHGDIQGLGKVAMGICMDINPYKFQTPWTAFEFGFHILTVKANLVIISMAWLTLEDAQTFTQLAEEPDMETLTYWVQRLEPIIRAEGEEEIIVVFANRCGVEGEAVYAGTSAVLGVQNGEVSVYGLLGRGTKELLVVNTEMPPFAKLVSRPDRSRDADEELSVSDGMSEAAVAPAKGEPKYPGQKSPGRAAASSQQNTNTTVPAHARECDECKHVGHFNTPHYYDAAAAPGRRASPRRDRTSGDGHGHQYQHPPKEAKSSRRTASPWPAYSAKASSGFRRAASTSNSYSTKFPSPREQYAPRSASPQDRYSPGLTSSGDGCSSPLTRMTTPPSAPALRDLCVSKEPSPEEWYGVADASHAVSSARVQAPNGYRERDEQAFPDLASPTFPEPTPTSVRPKLALSTGPETLPPKLQREPPRGMQPGNFFSSRDLCTPPETPFDDEPQPFIQKHWVPPSTFTYPDEPQWPEATRGTEGVGQLAGRRPSPSNGYAPARAVPTKPASRTQEVKMAGLHDTRHRHRDDRDIPPPRASRPRNSSRTRGANPDRRPTPATSERNTPRPRNEPPQPSTYPPRVPAPRREAAGPTARNDCRKDITAEPATPLQPLREKSAATWNSITIAASPSVFKTEFHPSETSFLPPGAPNHNPRKGNHNNHNDNSQPQGTLQRRKSVSSFLHHHDAAHYLPSPALPVHKAYQHLIYSAVEPGVSIDSMWAAAVAVVAGGGGGGGGGGSASKRHGSVSSEKGARLALGRLRRPDLLSPMSV